MCRYGVEGVVIGPGQGIAEALAPGAQRIVREQADDGGDVALRGRNIGEVLFRFAIDLARDNGCGLVQLTTDRTRPDAHRFYERLGFVASHEGMKLALEQES